MRAGICDMVAVARIINATLVVPELDKRSFWQDKSNFSDVFDEDYFITALANDVKIIRELPKELMTATRAVKHFRSWSGIDYYEQEIASLWDDYQVIRAAKSDSRLANNNLPPDIQKLRCRACYEALRFSPRIEAMGKLLVDRMRSYGPYIALHLRYEKDMLSFSGCTHDLSIEEANELTAIRKLLVRIFDKIANGTMKEGKKLSIRIIEMHKRRYASRLSRADNRQGSPRKRKGPISGTKGTDRFRSEEAFYVNPLPDCLCQKELTENENSATTVLR
ncbi:hypothetical protein M8C21_027862 [Ambrosia artemisiifolia]|uniref:O-fucosyltransferase family protein n=1 Tax=Ambrosia artemisiifolia TaxID=4212 RepID=A0AAD5CLL4_AMBAR|nr:hypothetical protein M8C21_027862 [Ambrosia artemisiifolia]